MSLTEAIVSNRYIIMLDNFLMKHQRAGLIICFIVLWCLIAALLLVLFQDVSAVESGTHYNKFGSWI